MIQKTVLAIVRRRRKEDRSDDDNISDDGEDVFDRGDKVEAKVKGWTKFYPGEITARHTDGTYDIRFDDGERKSRVKKHQIQIVTARIILILTMVNENRMSKRCTSERGKYASNFRLL